MEVAMKFVLRLLVILALFLAVTERAYGQGHLKVVPSESVILTLDDLPPVGELVGMSACLKIDNGPSREVQDLTLCGHILALGTYVDGGTRYFGITTTEILYPARIESEGTGRITAIYYGYKFAQDGRTVLEEIGWMAQVVYRGTDGIFSISTPITRLSLH